MIVYSFYCKACDILCFVSIIQSDVFFFSLHYCGLLNSQNKDIEMCGSARLASMWTMGRRKHRDQLLSVSHNLIGVIYVEFIDVHAADE